MKGLGRNQRGVLEGLLIHKRWPGSWVWDTPSNTERILESLLKRGLVHRADTRDPYRPTYTITNAGIAALQKPKQHAYQPPKPKPVPEPVRTAEEREHATKTLAYDQACEIVRQLEALLIDAKVHAMNIKPNPPKDKTNG
jgi:DNA-binding PadR family transcriptional regulator